MSSENLRLNVVAGRSRDVVGTIVAREGIMTNRGKIDRVTPKGTVVFDDGTRTSRASEILTVRHSDAVRYGYPYADGCRRMAERSISREGKVILA